MHSASDISCCCLLKMTCVSEKIAADVVSYNWYGINLFHGPLNVHFMTEIRIGYARCSTDKQDLTAQQEALMKLGISPERIYTDKGLTGSNRQRPGLDQALAAVRRGDTLVVPKLDRLARRFLTHVR